MAGTNPNPFNGTTEIRYTLAKSGLVKLAVYDLTGRGVTQLVSGKVEAGVQRATWRAEGLPSRVYLVRLETPAGVSSIKATLVR